MKVNIQSPIPTSSFCREKKTDVGIDEALYIYLLRSVKAGPKCTTCDTEVCESIAIIRKRIAIVRGD